MIDIEGLGVIPDSVILTIGACAFDPFSSTIYNEHSMYRRIDPESQPHRSIDDETVEWWSKQPPEAQEEAFGEDDRVPLDVALKELHELAWKSNRIWANGITYDMPILEDAYKSYDMRLPWKYYKVFDARTIYALDPAFPGLSNNHHALYDVVNQIDMLQTTLKKLGIKEFRQR